MGVAQPEPYLVLYDESVFLVVDCAIVTKIEFDNSPLILLSSYFVFNIQYRKGCHNLYSFLSSKRIRCVVIIVIN